MQVNYFSIYYNTYIFYKKHSYINFNILYNIVVL